jgi:hypothetical protein
MNYKTNVSTAELAAMGDRAFEANLVRLIAGEVRHLQDKMVLNNKFNEFST